MTRTLLSSQLIKLQEMYENLEDENRWLYDQLVELKAAELHGRVSDAPWYWVSNKQFYYDQAHTAINQARSMNVRV